MKIDDEAYKEILECFDPKDIPSDPTEARAAIENFIDLVEILMKPLPLPPAGGTSFKQLSSETPPSSPRSF